MAGASDSAVLPENAEGRTPLLLVCEHASKLIPPPFGDLGLRGDALEHHSVWDIGAADLARALAAALDAPFLAAPVSRLIVDVNRAHDAHDIMPATAEGAPVPGNENLTAAERAARIARYHEPFHAAIEALLAKRADIRAMVAIHSFTPTFFGAARPWHVGILHDEDARLADPMLAALAREPGLAVGRNAPYAPSDGVYYTLSRHASPRGLLPMMIEVRNDLLRDEANIALWAKRLSKALTEALEKNDLSGGSSAHGAKPNPRAGKEGAWG